MSVTAAQLQHLSHLAYLNIHPETEQNLINDINAMINFVDQLRQVDTNHIQPLTHPIDAVQFQRADVSEPCHLNPDLEKIAPKFINNLYWVPRVIK